MTQKGRVACDFIKMESAAPVRSVALLLAVMISFTVIETTTGLDLTPRLFHTEFTSCITKSGVYGKCVDRSYCNENYDIEKGGNIADNEQGALECTSSEWCCSDQNVITPPLPNPQVIKDSTSKCVVAERPGCPWCVKLYRDGKDRRRRESGFFCMGTLIGSRVILTTATCMIQARSQNLWARIPSSPDPNANYTIKSILQHPEYNSGSRENDLALLTIDPEPEWGAGGAKGACLDLEPDSLAGACIAAGIDENDNIRMTPLIATEGNCGSGSTSDSSCGHAIGETCSIVDGSPIMCGPNDGPFMMSGLSKLSCINDPPQSLLNNLVQAAEWLNGHLKGKMGLVEADYLKLSP